MAYQSNEKKQNSTSCHRWSRNACRLDSWVQEKASSVVSAIAHLCLVLPALRCWPRNKPSNEKRMRMFRVYYRGLNNYQYHFEVIQGIWNHNIGNFLGPYGTIIAC